MTYIIAEPCVGTCETACVEVCPVDCIHGPYDKEGAGAEAKVDGFVPKDEDMLYILGKGKKERYVPLSAVSKHWIGFGFFSVY